MSSHKSIDKICVTIVVFTVIIALIFCNGKAFGIETQARTIGYENRLFDNSKVHTVDIVIDDWDEFISTCENELYSVCNVVIDGELIKKVGIRAKGNTSLSSVRNMGSSRYSFKIEFDQYDKTKTYHGLDKLCLNNIIQDNTYMKDYLAYTLMREFGVDAPLCSFVYITVNGEDWGLYLAVEAIENSFLERNYGSNYGDLYKPDSLSFGGGGPGNGKDFSMTDFMNENFLNDEDSDGEEDDDSSSSVTPGNFNPGNFDMSNIPNMDFGDIDMSNIPNMDFGDFDMSNIPDMSSIPGFGGNSGTSEDTGDGESGSRNSFGGFGGFGGGGGFGGFGMGSSDVKLQYIDDDPDSYSNIFNNAKTTVNKADKNRLISSLKALSEQSDIENTVDVEEVIRYFVVHNYLCNGDSYTGSMIHNYYLYEKDGQLSMIPWDYNLAYGSFMGGSANSSVNAAIDTPVSGDMSDRPMISWIFDIEEYTEIYHEYFQEFLNSFDIVQMVEDTAALIDEYVEKDPTKFCTYEEFKTGVEAIKKFCDLRSQSVQGQLEGTIPSTSTGQSADSSSLIDTEGLNTSDMGSMGGGGGGFGGGNMPGRAGRNSSDNATKPEASGEEKPDEEKFNEEKPKAEIKEDTEKGQSEEGGPVTVQSKGTVSAMSLSAVKTDTGSDSGRSGGFGGGNMPGDGMPGGSMPDGFDPSQFGGSMPDGFDPSQFGGSMPGNFDSSQFGGNGSKDTETTEDAGTTDTTGDSGSAEKGSKTERPSSGKTGSGDRSSSDRSSFSSSSFSGFSGSGQSSDSTEYILLGVSAVILLAGVIFAALFKRRK